MKMKVRYSFGRVQTYLFNVFALLILFAWQNANAQVCTCYTIYALDNAGYIYPVKTSTAMLQILFKKSRVVSNTNSPDQISYSFWASSDISIDININHFIVY
jgi:hypothetical protein